jgi:threonine dehydrogenase-like Zn-dependent dehydrogenase
MHRVPVAGRRVAVVGVGSLGLCVVEAAVLEGAGEVIAISRSERGREVAREAGAAATLPPDRAAEVGAELVFETAGATPAVTASLAAVRPGGRVVVLGGHPRTTGLDLLDLTVREVVLEGSVSHCFVDFQRAAEGITAGTLARAHRPIAVAPLEDGPALLRAEDASVKRILVPGLR